MITLGCDPEFFCKLLPKEDAPKKEFVPICGLLGGTKKEPAQMTGLNTGFKYQEDGAAAEFNIPPCTSAKDFSGSIRVALGWLNEKLYKAGLGINRGLRSVDLDEESIKKFPNLAEIGCDPDYFAVGKANGKAYDPVIRTAAHLAGAGRTRGAGGHIHIGYDKSICPPHVLATLLDAVLMSPTLGLDVQGRRRQWWGTPGLHREKPYGLEYRPLSNFWIWSDEMRRNVFEVCINLVNSIQKNTLTWQGAYLGWVNGYWQQFAGYAQYGDERAKNYLTKGMHSQVWPCFKELIGTVTWPATLPMGGDNFE